MQQSHKSGITLSSLLLFSTCGRDTTISPCLAWTSVLMQSPNIWKLFHLTTNISSFWPIFSSNCSFSRAGRLNILWYSASKVNSWLTAYTRRTQIHHNGPKTIQSYMFLIHYNILLLHFPEHVTKYAGVIITFIYFWMKVLFKDYLSIL